MATLILSGDEIEYTIIPYMLNKPIEDYLLQHLSDRVLGFIKYNIETGKYTFTYAESDFTEAENHWSLYILRRRYPQKETSWIVYNYPPEKTRHEFNKLLAYSHECIYIDNWDVWSVQEKEAKVALITSWTINRSLLLIQ